MRINFFYLAVLSSALALASCLAPASLECGNGLVCPVGTHCAAKEQVCIKDSCGNSLIEPGEVCDDGNTVSGDGCSADCKSIETCGNGYLDVTIGEICDDGNTVSGDGCSADCRSKEICGNGYVDTAKGEVCDDGNNDSGDGCSADCKSKETCGNNIIDTAKGEVCDDGNNLAGDGCSADCKSKETCGNGIIDVSKGEVCDDGNNLDCDGCSANCKSNEKCGNGVKDVTVCAGEQLEICDDGNNLDGDGCSADCKSEEHCGNGAVNRGEQCDDGIGDVATDSLKCTHFCKVSFCGDGYTNLAANEICDTAGQSATCNANCTAPLCGDGIVNSDFVVTGGVTPNHPEQCDNLGAVDSASCNKDCSTSVCGDGYINMMAGEQCDDKGASAGCTSDCKTSSCGDGKVNTAAGEQCDVSGGADTSGCNGNTATPPGVRCKFPRCGDGYKNPMTAEQCDTAGESSTCNADCTTARCGDGKVNTHTLPPEQCDDANTNNRDDCAGCLRARCGDGFVWIGHEKCDDSNNNDGDGCSADCQLSTRCGDGTTDSALGEVCDDHNNVSGDGCSADCLSNETCGNGYVDIAKGEKCDDGNTTDDGNGCSADCKTNTHCGNGILETALGEVCDDGNNLAGDGCSADCLSNENCGNGYVDVARNEQCDDGNNNNTDACPNTCQNAFCGDGFVRQGTEACDKGPLNSFTGSCLPTCVAARCGDGFIQAGVETCDDGNMNNSDGCSGDCQTLETGFTCSTGPTGRTVCTPNCGDGVLEGTEVCDDHNNLACGGCNATCTAIQAPAPARGTIICVQGSSLRDGETVTISDGLNVVTFEFDVTKSSGSFNGVQPGHVAVQVNGGGSAGNDTPTIVSNNLRDAINAVSAGLRVTASNGGTSTISLVNDLSGVTGNVAIVETVQSGSFSVTGMAGGAGGDCATGTGCSVATDCASGSCNLGTHVCNGATCGDMIKNGSETDMDCGGSCTPCIATKSCLIGGDCQSGVCTGFICQSPSCSDQVKNGIESDVDCGGTGIGSCPPCGVGRGCGAATDCASGLCDSGNTNTCLATNTLLVVKQGAGTGTVSSNPTGLAGGITSCSATCSDRFQTGTIVALFATPASGSALSAWGTDCSGAGLCTVDMSAGHTVTATFVAGFKITVAKAGANAATGTVVSDVDPVIACGTSCAQSYPTNTVVTLTAAGTGFTGWTGGPCNGSSSPTCAITVTADVTTTANF